MVAFSLGVSVPSFDLVATFSDGVAEATGHAGEPLGKRRLPAPLPGNRDRSVEASGSAAPE